MANIKLILRFWVLFALVVFTACGEGDQSTEQKTETKNPLQTDSVIRVIDPIPVNKLPSWSDDDLDQFFDAFVRSCTGLKNKQDHWSIGGHDVSPADLSEICDRLPSKPDRNFLAEHFLAVPIAGNGLMTGYYEPVIDGSLTRKSPDQVPLYSLPDDLIQVDLSKFDADLSGRIRGKVVNNKLTLYDTRGQIDTNGLSNRADIIAYIDDPVEAFFLHVQGSGLINLPDREKIRVGYAGKNGHPYRSIGRYLIDQFDVEKTGLSMTRISNWLHENPDRMDQVLHHNPSYIFFRRLPINDGPLGAQGVKLTPARSLAVDLNHWPLGLPFWVSIPGHDDFPRLMMAQDTGSAIKGPVRGDIFWGRSAQKADAMANPGQFWVLIPRSSIQLKK